MRTTRMLAGFSCFLLCQAALAQSQTRVRPPEMVAAAAKLPAGSSVTGQPLTLTNVLSSATDRRRQYEGAMAYWNLFQAVAEYRYSFDCVANLQNAKAGSVADSAGMRLSRASASARLRQAELKATRTQCELARVMGLANNAAAPLPFDRPHVGAYRTNFQELFGGRTAPDRMLLIERTLPIRRQAIDERAAAVEAAEDVFVESKTQSERGGRIDSAILTAACEELERQQRSFISAVCDYNRDITEYGLSVAAPNAAPQTLAAMLIGPSQQSAPQNVASEPTGIRPTAGLEPIPDPMSALPRNDAAPAVYEQQQQQNPLRATSGAENVDSGWKTVEPMRSPLRDVDVESEPAPAPARNRLRPVEKNEPTLAPPRESIQKNEPTLTPPSTEANESGDEATKKPLVPVETSSSQTKRTTYKMPSGAGVASSSAALYPALVEVAASARAKQLTVALHWDRSLPERIGTAMNLSGCLARDSGSDRRATIEAFWRVRQRAAEYQIYGQQVELFDALSPAALERRSEPAEMLRLQAARLDAKATMRESHVALVEAQFALAQRIGAVGDVVWPMAATAPHAGNYELRLQSQPAAVAASWPVRSMTAAVTCLGEAVQNRAEAVVESDAGRVAAAERYRGGSDSVDSAVKSIAVQTEQTAAFLDVLTEYNAAIAEYVLAVVPANTPSTKLVAALVVKP